MHWIISNIYLAFPLFGLRLEGKWLPLKSARRLHDIYMEKMRLTDMFSVTLHMTTFVSLRKTQNS